MLWKFLIPILAITGVYLAGRQARKPQGAQPPTTITIPTPQQLKQAKNRRLILFVVLATMVTTTGWFIYDHWVEKNRPVIIRVIHVETGTVSTYRARSSDIHGRSFLTLDGRRVTLADVERMEVDQ